MASKSNNFVHFWIDFIWCANLNKIMSESEFIFLDAMSREKLFFIITALNFWWMGVMYDITYYFNTAQGT